jgi:uncharacterized RDD family membrane protein YckC
MKEEASRGFCQECGERLQDGWQFCPKCGRSQMEQEAQEPCEAAVTASEADLTAPVNTDLKPWSTVEYGSPWRRACAEFLDLMLVGLLLGMALPWLGRLQGWSPLWLLEAVSIPYRAVAESSKYQATVGKWLLGLVVTDQQYRKVSIQWTLARSVVKVVAFPVHAITLLTDRKHRGIADLAGGTVVIRTWH